MDSVAAWGAAGTRPPPGSGGVRDNSREGRNVTTTDPGSAGAAASPSHGGMARLDELSPERRALLAKMLRERGGQRRQVEESARPGATLDPDEDRLEAFPLSDIQQAYWIGRSDMFPLGGIASRAYFVLDVPDFDLNRFEAAWRALISRHDMLRTIVTDDGQQRVLTDVSFLALSVLDLQGLDEEALAVRLAAERLAMLSDLPSPARWPLNEVRIGQLDGARALALFSLDLLTVDASSITILLQELAQLYRAPEAIATPPGFTFREYVRALPAQYETNAFRLARDYWIARLDDLPPAPDLPLATNPAAVSPPRFTRMTAALDATATQRLRARASALGLTSSALLLTVYGEVLARWSASPRLTINIPLFNRLPLHPDVNSVVGPFTSVELLAFDARAGATFLDRARRVQAQLLDDLDHRQFDGVAVMRELARRQGAAPMPVVFTSLVDARFSDALESFGTIADSVNQTSQVWMDLHVDERAGALVLKWDAVDGLFPDGMIASMLAGYRGILEQLAADDAAWETPTFELLPADQLQRREALNNTDGPARTGIIQEQLWLQASERPDAPAVVTPSTTLSFRELVARANQVGRLLREHGAQPNQLVAIVMEKGWEQVVAAYGVLTSGAAYLPIDPDFPAERRRHLLEHGEVSLVLTQSKLDRELEWPATVRRFSVDDEATWSAVEAAHLEPAQSPTDLAYVLYTSGSTGLPKGVMIEHRNVLNRMLDVNDRFGVGPGDRALALTALHHDLSVYDLFGVLAAGGTLVVPSADGRRDPAHWLSLVQSHGVTVWNSVPAFMEMFVEYLEHVAPLGTTMPADLRFVILSGDWVPVSLPDRLRALVPEARVVSAGGPTETTVWDICYPIGTVGRDWASIPYGRPMTNARYYVLNDALEPCPDWVTGELYIAGTGLARGYWRDEERTRSAFITHPGSGERLYRSGDTGRLRPDGLIEFMGRADFQVKIQGQRIELGEIESTLLLHPTVRAAVVSTAGARPRQRLVAYAVATDGASLDPDVLRDYLASKLPAHMVPSAFVSLDRLPLTPNGKVDRRSLPEPDEAPAPAAPRGAQRTTGSTPAIVRIVEAVLAVMEPDVEANLLSLGASSIDMVRIGNQLEEAFGIRPRMDELFRMQTIAALAEYFDSRTAGAADTDAQPVAPGASEIERLIASYRRFADPAEIEAFKAQRLAIRRDADSQRLALPSGDAEAQRAAAAARRSQRRFQLTPVTLDQFARLLLPLRQLTVDDHPKYVYASAGGTYAVQTYVHVKPGRVAGVAAGTYYYHPVDHQLVSITPGAAIDRAIHVPFVNQPTFDEAAFSVLFVADVAAIAPIYGEHTLRFAAIESGIMAHALDLAAIGAGLGLCQIGSIEFDRVRGLFDLSPSHVLVHSALGGVPTEEVVAYGPQASATGGEAGRVATLLERVQGLTPAEVQALLAANRATLEGNS